MSIGTLSYGHMVLYTGIALAGLSVTAMIVGMAVFSSKRKRMKKQLIDKYGF